MATVTELSGQMGAVLGSVRWISITIFAIMLVWWRPESRIPIRMVLMERTKEIGMLRCKDSGVSDIFWIFIFEAGLNRHRGEPGGYDVSLPIGLLVHLVPFKPLGQSRFGPIPGKTHLRAASHVVGIRLSSVIIASVFAVLGPARKAARLLPVEAMRTTRVIDKRRTA